MELKKDVNHLETGWTGNQSLFATMIGFVEQPDIQLNLQIEGKIGLMDYHRRPYVVAQPIC